MAVSSQGILQGITFVQLKQSYPTIPKYTVYKILFFSVYIFAGFIALHIFKGIWFFLIVSLLHK